MRMLTLLLCLATPLLAQEKTYDLRAETPLKAGQKVHSIESTSMNLSMSVNGKEASTLEEQKIFDWAEVVLTADGKGNATMRRDFTKARRSEGGELEPFGFEGKSVRVTRTEGKPDTYSYVDGSPMNADDVKGLKSITSRKGDGVEDDNALYPPKPIRVGESWKPEIKAVADMFGEMSEGVDLSKSTARFTLKSVEKRGSSEFGQVNGVISLYLHQVGPIELQTPIVMAMTIDMDVCIDGSIPDGVLKMKLEMQGASSADINGKQVRLGVQMTGDNQMSTVSLR